MSRAFVNEDAGSGDALGKYPLPERGDPAFTLAAARVLLRGADQGDTVGAEAATGFYWGDPALEREVSQLLAEAREEGNERMEQLAGRYLRRMQRSSRPDANPRPYLSSLSDLTVRAAAATRFAGRETRPPPRPRASRSLHPLPELDVQQVAVRLEEGVAHLARRDQEGAGTPRGRRRARPRRTTAPPRTPPRSIVGCGIRRKRHSDSRQSSS